MSDGVRLSSDIYFPVGLEWPLPVILLRTPYNKKNWRTNPSLALRVRMFSGQGYICVVQDKRGRFESEGDYTLAKDDAVDGYDTIDWLIRQPWCDGNVGTYGCSYMGELQIYQAKLWHPNLKAMIPCAAGGAVGTLDRRFTRWGTRFGGAVSLATLAGWMHGMGSKVYARPPAELSDDEFRQQAERLTTAPPVPDVDGSRLLEKLPLCDMLKLEGLAPNDFEDLVTHDYGDPYWQQFDYFDAEDRIYAPVLLVDSWYDACVAETLTLFNHFRGTAISETARNNQYVIIGPGVHCKSEYASEHTLVGDVDMGDARFPHWQLYLDWFDYWLKGIDNRVTQRPPVHYYLMGKGQWRSAQQWPPANSHMTEFYLHSQGQANSCFGDGCLSQHAPAGQPEDTFAYDPACPVPTCGGPVCPSPSMSNGRSAQLGAEPGAFDQRVNESRDDVLVYTSEVLRNGLELAGFIKLVLYVSSDAKDTDFTAKLIDLYTDGRAINLQEGIIRARYREGMMKKVWMEAGQVYRVEIDLQATAWYFKPGHRIRLEVSSSNFPRFDRNLNTGGNNFDESEWLVAHNSVHHSGHYPSHLLLPVMESAAPETRASES
jgi:putative CocE/NonD family hydrolase